MSSAVAEPPSLRTSIRDAIRGSQQNFTTGNLNRAILLLAVPMVLEMLLESLFAVANVFWVARLGTNALAAVGLTETILTLAVAASMGLSMSITAMVSRRSGENDGVGAAVSAVQGIALGLGASVVMGVPSLLFAPRLLTLMGASPEIVSVGTGYARIELGANGVALLLALNNAIFRGAGNAAFAMRLLWVANIINLGLDPCFIFGLGPFPRLGVTGSALATLTGRTIGVVYQFYRLLRGTERIRITCAEIRLEIHILSRLARLSMTGFFQIAIAQASWMGLVRIVSIFGAAAVAGYTVAMRVIGFVILPSWGLSNATATLVGQNLGAGQPDRAETSVWRTGIYNVFFLGSVGILFVLFAEPVVRVFTRDRAVIALGAFCLRIVSCGNIAYAYGMIMLQAFNGAGDTVTPALVNLFGFWLLELPLAYWLALPLGFRSGGVFLSIVMAESVMAAISILLFRRGRWKFRPV